MGSLFEVFSRIWPRILDRIVDFEQPYCHAVLNAVALTEQILVVPTNIERVIAFRHIRWSAGWCNIFGNVQGQLTEHDYCAALFVEFCTSQELAGWR